MQKRCLALLLNPFSPSVLKCQIFGLLEAAADPKPPKPAGKRAKASPAGRASTATAKRRTPTDPKQPGLAAFGIRRTTKAKTVHVAAASVDAIAEDE